MTNVAILSQMRCRRRLSGGRDHLVERAAGGKLGIQFPAKLTRSAGARVEAFHYFRIDVFHEVLLPGDVNRLDDLRRRIGPELPLHVCK